MGWRVAEYSKIKAIEEAGFADVYCLATESGNFVANGILIKNCDALRYACSPFMASGSFGSPDEQLSYDQLRRKVFQQDDLYNNFNASLHPY